MTEAQIKELGKSIRWHLRKYPSWMRDDIAGDAWLAAARYGPNFRQGHGTTIQAFLGSRIRGAMVDRLRKDYGRQTRATFVQLDERLVSKENLEGVEFSADADRLIVLADLTDFEHQVLVLLYWEGLSEENTGRILHRSQNAIHERRNRIIKKLRYTATHGHT